MLGKAFFKNLFYKDSALLINVSRYVLTKKKKWEAISEILEQDKVLSISLINSGIAYIKLY